MMSKPIKLMDSVSEFSAESSPNRLRRWSYLHVRDLATATSFVTGKHSMMYWDMLLRYRDEKLDI